jgi:Conjugative transposon, TraM
MKSTNGYSEQLLRKRKLMLMAPLAFVPMLCLAFYGLGGGKLDAGASSEGGIKGLNMTLPLAHFDLRGQPQDKDGFYEKAKQDSMRLAERKKQDPYAAGKVGAHAFATDSGYSRPGAVAGLTGLNPAGADRQADEALARLDQLKNLLASKKPGFIKDSGVNAVDLTGRMEHKREGRPVADGNNSAAMEQLKGASGSPGDPQMERLDGMLDKLIRIQHPELVQGDTGRLPGSHPAALVITPRNDLPVGTMSSARDESEEQGDFMEIGVRDDGDSARELAIEAIINSDQTLTAGSTVALRIVQDFIVGSEHIAANQLIYGVASLAGERLTINITSIRVGQSIVPVSMQVYDMDGLAGIRVPGAITRDVSKESADQAISGLEMASVNPSLGAQAAGAGAEFAKSLASRKIRLVRVSLPAGYRVLLKNSKSLMR